MPLRRDCLLQQRSGVYSAIAPEGRNQYAWIMGEQKADVFLTHCTNAVLAQKEVKSLKIIRTPQDLSVGADYGLVVRGSAPKEAWRLAMYILSPIGQNVLRGYGFETTAMEKED